MSTALAELHDQGGRRRRALAAWRALRERYAAEAHVVDDEVELLERLFVASPDGTGWMMGISELSVSYRLGQSVTVRGLSEVVQRRPRTQVLTGLASSWGLSVLGAAAALAGQPYDTELFRELYARCYLGDLDPESAEAPMRFGVALELGGAAPVVKTYFDVHAIAAGVRPGALDDLVTRLGDTAGRTAWLRACPDLDPDTTRVIGVDFGAGGAVRSKIYWGARRLDWTGLEAAVRQLAGARHLETLARLECEVLGGRRELSSTLLSMCGASGKRALKLDVCLARLFDDDAGAKRAVDRFCAAGGATFDTPPFELVSGGVGANQSRGVHQYLGVELPADRPARVTIYYRPLGLETEHLNPAMWPRRREL